MLDTPECRERCCGGTGCAQFLRLRECFRDIACIAVPPPRRELYMCSTVRCVTGGSITIGMVVHISGVCWQVIGVVAVPPPGGDIYDSKIPVQCVDGCNDEICPQGEWYYLSISCVEGFSPVWVCGVTRCEVRGCYVLDPSNERRRLENLPPGANIRTIADLGPSQPDCCACAPTCISAPMLSFDPASDPDNCYAGVPRGRRCCCTFTNGCRIRILSWRTIQNVKGIPNPPEGTTTTLTMVGERLDANGCPTYDIQWTRDGESPVDEMMEATVPGLSCGQWPVASAMWLRVIRPPNTFGDGFLAITGTAGDTCLGFDEPDPPHNRLEVSGWSVSYSCQRMTSSVTYRFTQDPDTDITTTFRVSAQLVGLGPCSAPCGGFIVPGRPFDFPDDPDDIGGILP
jgi:hypothetical protein